MVRPGRLSAKNLIHSVAPVWSDGQHAEMWMMRESIRNALIMADKDLKINSISFPAMNTDKFGGRRDSREKIEEQKSFNISLV